MWVCSHPGQVGVPPAPLRPPSAGQRGVGGELWQLPRLAGLQSDAALGTKGMSGIVLENPVGISCGHLDMKSLFSSHTASVSSVSRVGGVEKGKEGYRGETRGLRSEGWVSLCQGASPLFLKSYPAYMASGITGLQVKITWGLDGCARPPRVQVGVHSTTEEPALGRDHPQVPGQ